MDGRSLRQRSLISKANSPATNALPNQLPHQATKAGVKPPRLMPVLMASPEAEARAFDKFVSPEPNTGCWLWTGSCDKDGYGLMRFSVGRRATTTPAHRAMWQFRNGTMPAGRYACHSCDTPSCVNPDHIWPGSPQDNRDDCAAKGRARYRPRLPDHLCTKRVSTAAAEAAALNFNVPAEQAAKLLRRAYKRREPAWVDGRVAAMRAHRAPLFHHPV